MKIEAAIRVARELQQYRDYKCEHFATPRSPETWVKQFAVKRATQAQENVGMRVMAFDAKRKHRTRWVRISDLVTYQTCLVMRRLTFQIRHHPIKKKPGVIRLPNGKWLLWDGNHRVAAALLRGERFVKVRHYSPK